MARLIATAASIAAALVAGRAAAQAAQAEPACRTDTFPQHAAFGASRVTPGARAALLSDVAGCPGERPACRQAVSVAAGDVVLTGRPYGRRWVCVFVVGPRGGGTAGWMRNDRLRPLRAPAVPTLRDWAGVWSRGDDRIEIVRDGDQLGGVGHAWWPAAHPDPDAEARFSAQARPSGNRIEFKGGARNDQTTCLVALVLVRDWMVADDNGECGDKPASFTGVYRRR